MKKHIFQGSGVAIVTPFHESGINFDAFRKMLEYQIENGTDAIIVCGTTGEPSTMTADEKKAAIQFAIETVNGRIPVIAGTGGNNTAKAIEDAKFAKSAGADASLVVTPYYNKTTQAGLIAHYTALADAVDIPIIIYNVPSRTGLNMAPETLAQLAEHPNIAAMKEASGNISQIVEMARLCQGKLDFYSGNDDHVVPMLAVGAIGVISVAANVVPREMHDMVATFLAGDVEASKQLQFKVNPLVAELFNEVNPIPVKTAMNLLGFEAGPLRLPLTDMSEAHLNKLKAALVDYGFTLK